MYDNNDEFGIDNYREDFSYVYSMNIIKVKLYRRITGEDNPSNGDFMGLSNSKSNTEYIGLVDININSSNIRERELDDSGQKIAGVRVLNGYAPYNTPINNGDIIVFTKSFLNMNIVEGERFIVKMKDTGILNGQFCYKNFEAYSIGDTDNISDTI